jgi:hypothetical protein
MNKEWELYFTFGDSKEEIIIMLMSFLIIASYQFYFIVMGINWSKVLKILKLKLSLTKIQKKIYSHFIQVYNYALIYSPLCLTVLCLAIYLLDFTTTNLFLSFLSIIFLFKSFLVQNHADSREFWKFYFYILQAMILIFMLIYSILSIPMYTKYCNPLLCSEE